MKKNVKFVKGPDGNPLTVNNLPPIGTNRWIARRKAEVVSAVNGGLLTLEEACSRYQLTVEEFLSWQTSVSSYGLQALRITRLQNYRK